LQSIGIVDIQERRSASVWCDDARLVTILGRDATAGFTERPVSPDVLSFYVEPAGIRSSREAAIFL